MAHGARSEKLELNHSCREAVAEIRSDFDTVAGLRSRRILTAASHQRVRNPNWLSNRPHSGQQSLSTWSRYSYAAVCTLLTTCVQHLRKP